MFPDFLSNLRHDFPALIGILPEVRVSSHDLSDLPESIPWLGIEARFRGIVGHAAVHPNGVNEYIALCNLLDKTAESDSARSAKWRRLPSRC